MKVLDFGLAKIASSQSAAPDESMLPTMQTRDGVVMGTVPCVSPEHLSGLPVDHRTDVFSFGVLLYEMATGRRPFQGALKLAGDLPHRVEQARVRYAYARMLLARDAAGDRDQARQLLTEARALSESMGLHGQVQRIDALTRASERQVEELPAVRSPPGLSAEL